ncbi:MAG: TetR/AcrR family transcriptional regulator [Bacteroidota bacterium]
MSPKSKAQFAEIREASKVKIMDAALELFATRGYMATSITAIGQRAGISKGLMYHYFESKEQLLREMINGLMTDGEKEVSKLITDDPRETFRNFIELFFREMRERHQRWRFLFQLTVQIDRFDFVHELAVNKAQGYLQVFEGLFAQMGWEDPRGEAIMLAAMMDGIGVQHYVLGSDYHLDEMEQKLLAKYCGS